MYLIQVILKVAFHTRPSLHPSITSLSESKKQKLFCYTFYNTVMECKYAYQIYFFNSYEIGSIKLVNGALARYKKGKPYSFAKARTIARTKLFLCEQKTACAMSN